MIHSQIYEVRPNLKIILLVFYKFMLIGNCVAEEYGISKRGNLTMHVQQ